MASPHLVPSPKLASYPWAGDETGSLDPYGMTLRQCVSYAAWFLNSRGTSFGTMTKGPRGVGVFGDASGWDSAAAFAGFTVSDKPVVGAIAQWRANESKRWRTVGGWAQLTAGAAGHVAVVTAVHSDGSVAIAQFNLNGSRAFSIMRRVYAPRYIYVPLARPWVF